MRDWGGGMRGMGERRGRKREKGEGREGGEGGLEMREWEGKDEVREGERAENVRYAIPLLMNEASYVLCVRTRPKRA